MMANLGVPFGSNVFKRRRIHQWKADQEDILAKKKELSMIL